MRYVVIEHPGQDTGKYLHQMFLLRADVFHKHLKWKGVKLDKRGYEIDRLDRYHSPVYILVIDDNDKVVGSQRLLPTTGPTLNNFPAFSRTLPKTASINDGRIIEVSRTCVDRSLSKLKTMFVLGYLLEAIGEVAIAAGAKEVLAQFEDEPLKMYENLGCEIEIKQTTRRLGKKRVHAGIFPVSPAHLRRIKKEVDRYRKLVEREDIRQKRTSSSQSNSNETSKPSRAAKYRPPRAAPFRKPWLNESKKTEFDRSWMEVVREYARQKSTSSSQTDEPEQISGPSRASANPWPRRVALPRRPWFSKSINPRLERGWRQAVREYTRQRALLLSSRRDHNGTYKPFRATTHARRNVAPPRKPRIT